MLSIVGLWTTCKCHGNLGWCLGNYFDSFFGSCPSLMFQGDISFIWNQSMQWMVVCFELNLVLSWEEVLVSCFFLSYGSECLPHIVLVLPPLVSFVPFVCPSHCFSYLWSFEDFFSQLLFLVLGLFSYCSFSRQFLVWMPKL